MEGPDPRAGEPAYAPPPPLRRSSRNRIVGGICGGLAERTGIDPVVFRVTIAVLALVGGAGVLMYGAGMLLIPDERTGRAPIDHVLRSGQHQRFQVAGMLLAIACGIVITGGIGGWFGSGSLAIVIVAALAVLVAHRRGANLRDAFGHLLGHEASQARGTARPGPAPVETAPQPTVSFQAPTQRFQAPAGPSGAPSAAGPPPGPPTGPPRAATGQWAAQGYVDLSGYSSAHPGSPAEMTVPLPAVGYAKHRTRSISWVVVLAAAVAAVVVAVVQAHTGLAGDVRLPLLSALGVLGVGLILSTWFGRARVKGWGVLLAIVLGVATVTQGFVAGGAYGDRVTWHPTTAAQLAKPYQVTASRARLDLTGLPLADSPDYHATAKMGAGQLVITVPRHTTVHVKANCGACRLTLFGQHTDFGAHIDRTSPAQPGGEHEVEQGGGAHAPAAKAPRFDLRLKVGVGEVVVRRAT